MKKLSALCALIAALAAISCSTNPLSHRDPQGIAANRSQIPTSEQLYLRGQFSVQRSRLEFWRENHFGEALDLSVRRPTVQLEGTVFAAKYGKPGYSLHANFFHDGKFYVARVPDQGVKNIYFQLSHFPPEFVAAHSLLRFEMQNGHAIEIVAPMPSENEVDAWQSLATEAVLARLPNEFTGAPYQLTNVAISAEAQWSKNDPKRAYDLTRGEDGAYIQIIRFVSMKSRFTEFYGSGNTVTQIQLDSKKSPNQVLATAFKFSERDGISRGYDTLNYNCNTMAFDIYEAATGVKDARWGYIRQFIDRRVPVFAPDKLAQFDGIDTLAMHLDPSLSKESYEAYLDIVQRPGRELCPATISGRYCQNLEDALDALKKAYPQL